MSAVSSSEIKQEFLKSRIGIAGIVILAMLVSVSIITALVIPVETFQQWNNPQSWIEYPKTTLPSWVNLFMIEKIPEHKILEEPVVFSQSQNEVSVPAAITTEAGLSFLGLGDPSFPTWGQILHDANTFGAAARGLWWWIMPPGVMIAITGLAFVFIGNALDAIVNPKLKR